MHAEFRLKAAPAELLTLQGLSENRGGSWLKLGREFGSILENQEIVVCAKQLASEALNDHSNALATADARRRKTVAPGATL